MEKSQLSPPKIVEIVKKWKNSPLIDPYNYNEIILSVNPKSEYVILYKKVIDNLIKHITFGKPTDYQLTIEDCKHIKNELPNNHAYIEISGKKILYDHLFIKYFIKKEKKYKYDEKYKEDIDIYLYLNVFNSINKKLKLLPKEPLPKEPLPQLNDKSDSLTFLFKGDDKEYYKIEDLLKDNIRIITPTEKKNETKTFFL